MASLKAPVWLPLNGASFVDLFAVGEKSMNPTKRSTLISHAQAETKLFFSPTMSGVEEKRAFLAYMPQRLHVRVQL